jgi:L-lactate dehydrogenase complex protein LldG
MSNQESRDRIVQRLKASGAEQILVPEAAPPAGEQLDRDARIERLAELMTAIRTEVHIVATDRWLEKLQEVAREKGWQRMLIGPGSQVGDAITGAWGEKAPGLPELVPYAGPIETFKEELFAIDAGITGVRGAVADTGAIVLWPTPAEPRLLSLVPPVHVAVLDADTIHDSLAEMMDAENWAAGMPTNALLISGPSKTADIEFTLVFGVHGPKELVVLIRT